MVTPWEVGPSPWISHGPSPGVMSTLPIGTEAPRGQEPWSVSLSPASSSIHHRWTGQVPRGAVWVQTGPVLRHQPLPQPPARSCAHVGCLESHWRGWYDQAEKRAEQGRTVYRGRGVAEHLWCGRDRGPSKENVKKEQCIRGQATAPALAREGGQDLRTVWLASWPSLSRSGL